jgi:hypothetical protein
MAESKQFKIRAAVDMQSMKEVYVDGGGQLPNELSGMYTDARQAQWAIDRYLANRKPNTPAQKRAAKKTAEA